MIVPVAAVRFPNPSPINHDTALDVVKRRLDSKLKESNLRGFFHIDCYSPVSSAHRDLLVIKQIQDTKDAEPKIFYFLYNKDGTFEEVNLKPDQTAFKSVFALRKMEQNLIDAYGKLSKAKNKKVIEINIERMEKKAETLRKSFRRIDSWLQTVNTISL
ncbi:MAG: hypothetical protein V4691_02640 [Pseudomonadota bacterium]